MSADRQKRKLAAILCTDAAGYSRLMEAERGVELDPNSAGANFQLAVVLRYAGKSKEAIPVIQKALRLEPIPPDIYVQNWPWCISRQEIAGKPSRHARKDSSVSRTI